MSVRIERIYGDDASDDDDGTVTAVALLIDGVQVQIGRFGGEPEDNSERRDYAWVIPMLQRSIKAERERCAEIVKRVCAKAVGSESTRVGVYLPEILAEEITKQIRGEG